MTRTNLQTLIQYKSEHCLTQSKLFFPAISCREQVPLQCDDVVHFVLEQHT
jgi:hypothetical protein